MPEFRSARAKALFNYLEHSPEHPYARVINADVSGIWDTIDIGVEPELAQDRAVDIHPEEPVRLLFAADDSCQPFIFSGRADFPLNLVHTNYVDGFDEVALCLWEESWSELRRTLTPHSLVERLRAWFSRMASGTLHQDGQPPEPLIRSSSHTLVIPPGAPAGAWSITNARQVDGKWIALLDARPNNNADFSVLRVELPPRVHSALREYPKTLADLRALISDNGGDLDQSLNPWICAPEHLTQAAKKHVIILLITPRQKVEGGPVESYQAAAFMPGADLQQLGKMLGLTLQVLESANSVARIPPVPAGDLGSIPLDYWRVVQRLDRETARKYAGTPAQEQTMVAIGAGAIGSNVVIGTIRAGLAKWFIIDDDIVLPHNTVRQFQDNRAIGTDKAYALAEDGNHILAASDTVRYLRANLLSPGASAAQINAEISEADATIDFSASPSVLARIADNAQVRRGVSAFFNPEGNDLVMLVEDRARGLRLDEIEAQYFLALGKRASLRGHLAGGRTDFIRYANACQDLTRPVAPWKVQTLSGIASGELVSLEQRGNASAKVWRMNPETAEIVATEIELAPVNRFDFGQWQVKVSSAALRVMNAQRAAALPNETGGILLGSFDLERKVMHVLDAVPAPPDSHQSPTYFVRGAQGLLPTVEAVATASAGNVGYIGEWHSHPDGAAARPSQDDEAVFAFIQQHLGAAGTPYLIAICGQHDSWLRGGYEEQIFGEISFNNV